jgi:hypothetical protein
VAPARGSSQSWDSCRWGSTSAVHADLKQCICSSC